MQKPPLAHTCIAQAATLFIAFCIAISAPAGAWAQGALPNLGDGQEMGIASERQLGQRIAREIYRDPDYIDDPVMGEYVQRIWQPLLQAARARGEITPELSERFAWEVLLVRDRSINAFALPGGYMGIHLGLIAVVGNRDELASVMAHELSHVTQRHIARMTTQQSQQAPWMMGAMILAALAARKNPDVTSAIVSGSQAVGAQAQLNFSRDMEREADRIGYQVMQSAQFNVQGFVGMFDKLALANRINDNGSFPYLRTHPLTSERIGDMQARMQIDEAAAPALAKDAALTDAQQALAYEHALMAARARLLADPSIDNLRTELVQAQSAARLPAHSTPQQRSKALGQLYGAALAALKLRELATAYSLAQSALAALNFEGNTAFPHTSNAQAAIKFIVTEIALAQGNPLHALDLLRPYVPSNVAASNPPGSQASTVNAWSRTALLLWAQAHTALPEQTQDLAQVVGQLQLWVAAHPQDALAWSALSGAYNAQNQPLRAIRAQAEARVALLDYTAALDRFKAGQAFAREHASTDHIESSIIDARARAVQAQVKELMTEKVAN